MCHSHLIYTVRPCLIHTCHAILRPCRSRQGYGTARLCCAVPLRRTVWSEHGKASVNQTRPHCVNQMGKTHSKPLAARHGRRTAWARHTMCESALSGSALRRKGVLLVYEIQETPAAFFGVHNDIIKRGGMKRKLAKFL